MVPVPVVPVVAGVGPKTEVGVRPATVGVVEAEFAPAAVTDLDCKLFELINTPLAGEVADPWEMSIDEDIRVTGVGEAYISCLFAKL